MRLDDARDLARVFEELVQIGIDLRGGRAHSPQVSLQDVRASLSFDDRSVPAFDIVDREPFAAKGGALWTAPQPTSHASLGNDRMYAFTASRFVADDHVFDTLY